jgi:hypothetical protein
LVEGTLDFFIVRSLAFIIFCVLLSCKRDEMPEPVPLLQLTSIQVGSLSLDLNDASKNVNAPVDQPVLISFGMSVDTASARKSVRLVADGDTIPLLYSYINDFKTISTTPEVGLSNNETYTLVLKSGLKGKDGSVFPGLVTSFTTVKGTLQIVSFTIDGSDAMPAPALQNISLNPVIELTFSTPVQLSVLTQPPATLTKPGGVIAHTAEWSAGNTKLKLVPSQKLDGILRHTIFLSNEIKGSNDEVFNPTPEIFYTIVDPIPRFPVIPDEELLTLVQKQTFKYFWDFGHPASGMARERNTSGNTVTTGGTGFGLMSIIVGIERNFISRADGVVRLNKIVTFLETADRFHGAWSHWVDGNSGDVIPFSPKDNGGDLVETSFLVQGLLAFRQYLQASDTTGNNLINRITNLWKGVEWDWYRKNNENVLYWHWSPNYNWDMNFPMYGYFEEQITYFLGAASPTHGIPKIVYSNGYGRNGAIVKNNTYYNIKLPLEAPSPLFWVQYSYLGLDPHFSDDYANYWEQNVNATLINRAYCIANPKNFVGYSEQCWGLTSSDSPSGYAAHSPQNDLGVITPTAALSSFPYTPVESMQALKFFYYSLGDKTWGPYGFYDAFNITQGWYANSYLAIDQGPIIVMIENYRTGLLWNLFMSAPEVQAGKTVLGFTN